MELEVDDMCNLSRGIAEEGIRQGLQQGLQQGIRQGLQQGEDMFAQLMQKLFELGRTDDARRATEDKVYRHELMREMLGQNQ
jgi:flagellar biosynthesis/type III secretory pathway protein FliH